MGDDIQADAEEQSERDLRLGGVTLHVVTRGHRTTPERAVLLIHGITGTHVYLDDLARRLADAGWYAVVPDLRGRGLSEKPAHGYGIPIHADDMLGLLDALGLARAHLVGHSLGAQIALYLAAIYSERVGRIVLGDGGGAVPPDAQQTIRSSVNRLGTVFPSIDAYLDALRKAAPFPWSDMWERYYRYDAQTLADGSVTSRMSRSTFDEEWAALMATRTEALAGDVKTPTLIVRAGQGTRGPDEGFILPAEEAEEMRQAIPGSRLVVVPDTNHYTVVLAEPFIRETLAFLSGG
jgi:pimeloyl-ACP methyl ester carboxylesterase